MPYPVNSCAAQREPLTGKHIRSCVAFCRAEVRAASPRGPTLPEDPRFFREQTHEPVSKIMEGREEYPCTVLHKSKRIILRVQTAMNRLGLPPSRPCGAVPHLSG